MACAECHVGRDGVLELPSSSSLHFATSDPHDPHHSRHPPPSHLCRATVHPWVGGTRPCLSQVCLTASYLVLLHRDCVCVCIDVCVHAYLCARVRACVCAYMRACVLRTCMHASVHACVCVCVCTHVSVHACVCVCVCVCMCARVLLLTHTGSINRANYGSPVQFILVFKFRLCGKSGQRMGCQQYPLGSLPVYIGCGHIWNRGHALLYYDYEDRGFLSLIKEQSSLGHMDRPLAEGNCH